jgi:hypothetical protein
MLTEMRALTELWSGYAANARTTQRIRRDGPTRSTTARRSPNPPRTLPDGTIRRYDNAHEDTKGHELHIAGQLTQIIQLPGMVALWQRFWEEVLKTAFDPTPNPTHPTETGGPNQ